MRKLPLGIGSFVQMIRKGWEICLSLPIAHDPDLDGL